MYNIDFLPQIEAFRRDLESGNKSYSLPEVLECHEDVNGEYVPNPVESGSNK
ncbi:hypothetical protein HOD75_01915 [archaeon]|jgi:hypothetical protein|nr:hypothetical protein [archaeon]MBT4241633.1 hypothetical protein [archaeon]MBT4418028.1 hypothetical protein [archaeon]